MIDSEQADWSREKKAWGEWNPGKSLLASIRSYQKSRDGLLPFSFIRKPLAVLRHRFWSVVSGADIPLNSNLGGGLLLPHPNGIVIHPCAKIGPNCLIFQQVTLGTRGGLEVPEIGGHVDIGAGAKLLGGIHIGKNSLIVANAVVLIDVPAAAQSVGVPAVILKGRT